LESWTTRYAGWSASGLATDTREVSWWVLVGAGSGALAGLAVGGIGGRLAMLILRLTSPDTVLGLTSDDGFEIGVVSTRTLDLVTAMATVGAVNGVLYAALRGAIPARLRMPLWVSFAGALGGAAIVHEDGVDFALLEPAALAVALFVLLPAAAAALVVLLVERWLRADPWPSTRLSIGLCAAALAGSFALVFAAAVAIAALAIRRVGASGALRRIAAVVVPAGLVVVTLVAGWELVSESTRIVR
jgi:hypothetical protein